MRRTLLLAIAALGFAPLITVAYGCGSDDPNLEDICGWLRDTENCYRDLHIETGDRCGEVGVGNGPVGFFISRDALDICFLEAGGQVVFDTPPDLTAFPITSTAFTRLDALAQTCGTFSFTGTYSYSVNIAACTENDNDGGIPKCIDSANGSVSGEGADPNNVVGGTFSVTTPDGRDLYDTTCTINGKSETHHFNRLEVEKCSDVDQLLPKAEIESDPGRTLAPDDVPPTDPTQLQAYLDRIEGYAGYIRFRVYYPPGTGDLENANPEVVEYFNCRIPPAAPLCANGAKDTNAAETDIDCGGTVCDTKCGSGQGCVQDSDCGTDPATMVQLTCQLDPMDSFRKCL